MHARWAFKCSYRLILGVGVALQVFFSIPPEIREMGCGF